MAFTEYAIGESAAEAVAEIQQSDDLQRQIIGKLAPHNTGKRPLPDLW